MVRNARKRRSRLSGRSLGRIKLDAMVLNPNKPYLAFIAVTCTAGLLAVGALLTYQMYVAAAGALVHSADWSWPVVIALDVLCLIGCGALYRKIYADYKTQVDDCGISRPALWGPSYIAWKDVTNVQVFGGVGIHVFAGSAKIVLSPYAYKEPKRLIEKIQQCVPQALAR